MKPKEIAARLVHKDFAVTPERLQKMQRLAQRSNMSVREVLDAIPSDQQAAVRELAEKRL